MSAFRRKQIRKDRSMVITRGKDGVVQLYLNGELKLEQPEVDKVTIGSKVEWVETDAGWIETKSDADYDMAFVGKDAALTYADISDDGSVFVADGGKISNINVNGGTFSGSAMICENASGWYGSGICLTASMEGKGAVSLTGATFSGCAVNPLNGSTGHGGAIETYGGTLTATDGMFVGNSANGFKASGGAMALLYSTNTVTGGTFSGNAAYYGGAIHQNGGSLTVTGALFAENRTAGDPSGKNTPGGGAFEFHNGATASVSGSTFSANTAYSGGAICNDTSDEGNVSSITVDASIFDANTADYLGGAVYNYAEMTISDSSFTGNKVINAGYSSFGGAVANTKNGVLTVTGSDFSGNSASYGGAVASFVDYRSSDTATLTVEDAEFKNNTSASGGGIYIQSGAADMTVISGSDFSGNTATSGGGAICQCFGAMTVTGGTFTGNNGGIYHGTEELYGSSPADFFQGGAIAAWDCGTKASSITGAKFDSNTASYGGAISYSYASAPLVVSDCEFLANGGETTEQGGAVWNRAESTGIISVKGCTFSGNTAKAGGAVWNGGSMKLENVVFATATDTVYNNCSLTFAGVNSFGAEVVNDGRITFSLAAGTDALVSDLGRFAGDGSYLLTLSADAASAGAGLAASCGTFTGILSVKYDGTTMSDAFTMKDGSVENDLVIAGDTVLRLMSTDGALSVGRQVLQTLVPAVSKDGSIITWSDGEYTGGYLVEIAQDGTFDGAIRIATNGTAVDVIGNAGAYSCRAAETDGAFKASASCSSSGTAPQQAVSNGNGRADIFFSTIDPADVWSFAYCAKNTVTGETASITGKNRIRDTFSGSESDANILYLSDMENGDALFMDDIYSEFGDAARVSLIREVRAGAGDDVVDMTTFRYESELAGMTARGGDGDDVLWGAAGGNKLFGDAGNDLISGGTGDDLIAGGAGNDTLAGGGGSDTFTFGENWGADVVSQAAGGTVTLWFESGDISKWNTSTLTYTDGANSVKVSGVTLDKITLNFGGETDPAAFNALAASGAFLGSTTEAVFESGSARTQGILASL
jgi:hypothetical protein